MILLKYDKEYVVFVKGVKVFLIYDREKIVFCLKMYNLVEFCVGVIFNFYERVFDKIVNWYVLFVFNEYFFLNYELLIY